MVAKFLIKEGEKPTSPAARERIGKFSGILGIALNTLLAAGKIAVGALFGMISVLADGMNNLTDCGSNVVSVIGFKMSGKPADKEHPFGHQRAESISALVIALSWRYNRSKRSSRRRRASFPTGWWRCLPLRCSLNCLCFS